MKPEFIIEKNLLAQHLYAEWLKDSSRTLAWWGVQWKAPLSLVESWVRGTRKVGPAHRWIFDGLPFSADEYFASDWGFVYPPDAAPLPAEFVESSRLHIRASQHILPDGLIPEVKAVAGPAPIGLFANTRTTTDDEPQVVEAADDTAQQICDTVLEQGFLTKEQIVTTWGLSEEDYKRLHRELCKNRRLESGPHRVGGLVARRSARSQAGDDLPLTALLREWEKRSVERLQALLSQTQLLNLVGALESGIRTARRVETGEDRPSRKSELATALVLQHGIDLFASPEIRRVVANALNIESPGNWHPGKNGAARFVEEAMFPSELIGVPTPESAPDVEYLESRFRLKPLEMFQKEVQRGLLETLQDPPGRRCIVTLPTGGGKTRVAVESISYWLTDRYDHAADRGTQSTVLWLAHTEELCEQACACFKQVWEGSEDISPVTLVRFWGSYTKDLVQTGPAIQEAVQKPTVIVSTPQRIASLIDGKARGGDAVLGHVRDTLGLVVIDEAHRAAAPNYRRIIEVMGRGTAAVSVVGLTATPFRMEYVGDDPERGTKELKEIFHRIVEPAKTLGENPRKSLQAMQVLAEPLFETIPTTTRIRIPDAPESDTMTEADIDRIDRVLAIRADNSPRRMSVLKKILDIASDELSSVIYFGPSVRDAECMAFLLRERGVSAAVVSGRTRDVTRRRIIDDFKGRNLKVLCNCEVLTTGFDAPRVTHVVIARPTVSRVLYEQIVGRGLRGPKFGGTATCVVIDCQDEISSPRPVLGYEEFRRVWTAKHN